MPEMVIPGTYITVRSEGLISAGRVATGIVGVIGTAARGPVGKPITLAGFAEARDLFGLPDGSNRPADGGNSLTLVRALELLYNNGAASVVAVRVANTETLAAATYAIQNDAGNTIATLQARTPGSWGNAIQVEVEPAEEDVRIEGEVHSNAPVRLNYAPIVVSPENRIRVGQGTKEIRYREVIHDEQVRATVSGGASRFTLSRTPVRQDAEINQIQVVDASGNEVTSYQGVSIGYGSSAPADDRIRINLDTGEIQFSNPPNLESGQSVRATYVIGPEAAAEGQVIINTRNGEMSFAAKEAPTADNPLLASYVVDRDRCATVRLTYGTTVEQYDVPDAFQLAEQVNRSSALVSAEADEADRGASLATGVNQFFGRGSNTRGNNGAAAGSDEYAIGLESIANQLINIVVLAGQDANTTGAELLAHLRTTEQTNYERIGVIGASGASVRDFLGHNVASDRMILVAPGLAYPDGTTLPPAYTAAAIAGLISSLSVQSSLTNRPVVVPGLTLNINRGQQAQLIRRNVLTVIPKQGYRVLKGITTSGEGTPFSAIPTRRIVDFAKYGVRSAADPYIGRLNNSRVRSALQATLDAFLTRMVEDEALTGYDLAVTATRAQEIAGEVSVTMTLQPTFSIDFIRVTMNLQ